MGIMEILHGHVRRETRDDEIRDDEISNFKFDNYQVSTHINSWKLEN